MSGPFASACDIPSRQLCLRDTASLALAEILLSECSFIAEGERVVKNLNEF